MQFPVSSGQQHRITENEWVPVEPTKQAPPKPVPPVTAPVKKDKDKEKEKDKEQTPAITFTPAGELVVLYILSGNKKSVHCE